MPRQALDQGAQFEQGIGGDLRCRPFLETRALRLIEHPARHGDLRAVLKAHQDTPLASLATGADDRDRLPAEGMMLVPDPRRLRVMSSVLMR